MVAHHPSTVKEPLNAFRLKLRKRPKQFFIKKRGILLGSAQFFVKWLSFRSISRERERQWTLTLFNCDVFTSVSKICVN